MAFSFVRDAVNALGCAFVVAWSVRKNVVTVWRCYNVVSKF